MQPLSVVLDNVLGSIGILYSLGAIFLNSLDCAICEYALLLPWREYAFDRPIGEPDLLHSIRVVLFNLVVREFENLKAVRHSCLCCLSFAEEINNFLVWVSLFDVPIYKVYYLVAVGISFSPNFVGKDHLFLAIAIHSLNFAIGSDVFSSDVQIFKFVIMILIKILNIVLLRRLLVQNDTLCMARNLIHLAFGWALLPYLLFNFFKL